jgi:hypothetical protein
MSELVADLCVALYALAMFSMILCLLVWLWQDIKDDIKDRGKK